MLGCDAVVTAGADTRATMRAGKTAVVVNTQETMTGDFTRNADLVFPAEALMRGIERAAGARCVDRVDATRIATALTGDAIATNLFMLGHAWQKGHIPLSRAAIERGHRDQRRRGGDEPERVRLGPAHGGRPQRGGAPHRAGGRLGYRGGARRRLPRARKPPSSGGRRSSRTIRTRRTPTATRGFVERVRTAERSRAKGMRGLAEAVARGYFKLLAYKDEYEVARLHCAPEFRRRIEATFEGDWSLEFHLAPPLFAPPRPPPPASPRKARYGLWMMRAFAVLARLKGLRGTMFDPFGYTRERRRERALIDRYEQAVASLLGELDHTNHALAVEIASLPERIRGFGHVKGKSIEEAQHREAELLERFRAAADPPAAA